MLREKKEQNQKNKLFRVFDVFLCLAVLLAAAAIVLLRSSSEDAECFTVNIDGETQKYRLDKAETYEFISNGVHITVVADGETVRVKSSECPDKVCVNTGKISSPGQMIVCSPGHFSVKIESGGDSDALAG